MFLSEAELQATAIFTLQYTLQSQRPLSSFFLVPHFLRQLPSPSPSNLRSTLSDTFPPLASVQYFSISAPLWLHCYTQCTFILWMPAHVCTKNFEVSLYSSKCLYSSFKLDDAAINMSKGFSREENAECFLSVQQEYSKDAISCSGYSNLDCNPNHNGCCFFTLQSLKRSRKISRKGGQDKISEGLSCLLTLFLAHFNSVYQWKTKIKIVFTQGIFLKIDWNACNLMSTTFFKLLWIHV